MLIFPFYVQTKVDEIWDYWDSKVNVGCLKLMDKMCELVRCILSSKLKQPFSKLPSGIRIVHCYSARPVDFYRSQTAHKKNETIFFHRDLPLDGSDLGPHNRCRFAVDPFPNSCSYLGSTIHTVPTLPYLDVQPSGPSAVPPTQKFDRTSSSGPWR